MSRARTLAQSWMIERRRGRRRRPYRTVVRHALLAEADRLRQGFTDSDDTLTAYRVTPSSGEPKSLGTHRTNRFIG